MKTKRLFNTSEYKTFNEICSAIEGKGFYLHPEMQLKKVIELDEGETLPKKENETFKTAYFDFVVYNKELFPEFVIEFDGPMHRTERNKRADIRKNRLCERAKLPLLRIDDSLLTEYEEVSLLGYIVRRFVAYRNNIDDISREAYERRQYTDSAGDLDDYDVWNDPGVIFNLNHPFPVTIEIAERLYNNYEIITSHIDGETYHNATSKYPHLEFNGYKGEGPIYEYTDLHARRIDGTYRLEKYVQDSLGKYDLEKIHELSIKVDYRWGVPTYEETDSKYNETHETISSVLFQGIPGTSMRELADNFCDFLAIRELEKWALNNLKKRADIGLDLAK